MTILAWMIIKSFEKRTQVRVILTTLIAAVIGAIVTIVFWESTAMLTLRANFEAYYLSFREGGWVWMHARSLAVAETVSWTCTEVPMMLGAVVLIAEAIKENVRRA